MAQTGSKYTKKKPRTCFHRPWIKGVGITLNHIVGFITLLFYRDVSWAFMVAALVSGFLNMLGITAGYHRLWSHNAFVASTPLKYFLALIGSMSWQGSIRWWVLRHRLHHRFTDTDYDPYDSTKGFYFAHYGWLFESEPPCYEKTHEVNMADLDADKVVMWNRRYTPHCVIGLGLILPLILGFFMGDALAGFLWIGVVGRIISWNGIFAINSFAHYVGERDFNIGSSAATNFICAVFSNGEGNHSYHHEFPYDYRHGIRWWQYDPTKWIIWVCEKLGSATKLRRAPSHLIEQIYLQTKIKELSAERDKIQTGLDRHMQHSAKEEAGTFVLPLPRENLPITTLEKAKLDIKKILQEGHEVPTWVIIGAYLCDVTTFKSLHPGGKALLQAFHLKDGTQAFTFGKNQHTVAAQEMVKRFAIARVAKVAETNKADATSSATTTKLN